MGSILLQTILRITFGLIKKAIPKSVRLQELMREKESFIFQIRTKNGKGGYFELKNGQLSHSFKTHANPSFEQVWDNGFTAVKTMLSKDETDLLRAFEDGKYRMKGDFTIALWFNEVMKLAKP
ncbi:MAG: hypothetical protein EBS35_08020 [Bacteroidetes bacterium]|nr:hypothetical protein [Bacteroidota bacterium]